MCGKPQNLLSLISLVPQWDKWLIQRMQLASYLPSVHEWTTKYTTKRLESLFLLWDGFQQGQLIGTTDYLVWPKHLVKTVLSLDKIVAEPHAQVITRQNRAHPLAQQSLTNATTTICLIILAWSYCLIILVWSYCLLIFFDHIRNCFEFFTF